MITHASRRVLTLGKGRNWLGVTGRGKKQVSVDGLASIAQRNIQSPSAPAQIHTSAYQNFPNPALSSPVNAEKETPERSFGEPLSKAKRALGETTASTVAGYFEWVRVSPKVLQIETLTDYRYLNWMSKGRMLTDELRRGFDGCVGLSWDHYDYGPWRQLLERLFPDTFGYGISLEKVLEETLIFSDGATVHLEEWFLVVRQPTADQGGPRVRLLACGFGGTLPIYLEDNFADLLDRMEPKAVELLGSGRANERVAWLAFCGRDFCWGEFRYCKAVRLGQPAHVQRDAGERTLLNLAQHVHTLSVRRM